MRRVLAVARREWRDQLRQPWMLAAVGAVTLLTAGAVLALLALLGHLESDPARAELFARNLAFVGLSPEEVVGDTVSRALAVWAFLLLSQLMGTTAVLAGHSVLHDRECGALPFLLLAPLGPGELLLGKVLGSLGAPALLTLGLGLPLGLGMALLGDAAASPFLPLHPSWWTGVVLGGLAWAGVVAALSATLSGLARDVRTAQQVAWLLVFLANLLVSGLLTLGLAGGWLVGLLLAGGGLMLWAPCVLLGGRIVQGAAVA